MLLFCKFSRSKNFISSVEIMISSCKASGKIILFALISLFWIVPDASARDYYITGKVTDPNGTFIPEARISMVAGTTE